MREILFRGKDIKGRWHIGLLAHIGNAWYISNSAGIPTACEVIPETVGQYTGLTDKDGEKIFEGDIIEEDNGRIGFVTFDGGVFIKRWIGRTNPTQTILFEPSGSSNILDADEMLIGNGYDNPELFKECGVWCEYYAFSAEECKRCAARKYCDRYKEYVEKNGVKNNDLQRSN